MIGNNVPFEKLLHLLQEARGLTTSAGVESTIDAIRHHMALGPVLVYSLDWRASGPESSFIEYRQFCPWIMRGVRNPPPMYGIIPREVSRWLHQNGEEQGKLWVSSADDHIRFGGRTGTGSFWDRERIISYYKRQLNNGQDIIIFNRSSHIDHSAPFNKDDIFQLEELAILLAPFIDRARTQIPKTRDLRRHARITLEIANFAQSLHRKREPSAEEMLAELLQRALGIFGRGDTLGAVHRLYRKSATECGTRLSLKAHDYVGVPGQLLVRGADGTPRFAEDFVVQAVPERCQGIISWVAYHERALFVESLSESESINGVFDLKQWNRECLQGADAIVAVPIKDPRESRLYGVLCFETRTRGAFKHGDVFYLEQFAQQAGVILSRERLRGLERSIEAFAKQSPRDQKNQDNRREIAQQIADYLLADATIIWGYDPQAKRCTKWVDYYRDRTAAAPESEIRPDGWTQKLLHTNEEKAQLIEISYCEPARHEAVNGWVFLNSKYWIRVRKFDEINGAWQSTEPLCDMNPHVVDQKFLTILAVPLRYRDEPHPVGVLWIKWHEWKADRKCLEPEIGDMEVILKVAQRLGDCIFGNWASTLGHLPPEGRHKPLALLTWQGFLRMLPPEQGFAYGWHQHRCHGGRSRPKGKAAIAVLLRPPSDASAGCPLQLIVNAARAEAAAQGTADAGETMKSEMRQAIWGQDNLAEDLYIRDSEDAYAIADALAAMFAHAINVFIAASGQGTAANTSSLTFKSEPLTGNGTESQLTLIIEEPDGMTKADDLDLARQMFSGLGSICLDRPAAPGGTERIKMTLNCRPG